MTDILIRGVALPKYGCAGCYFKTGKYCGIIAKNENVEEYSLRAERHPDCPLHELPPHGDLIDRREIISDLDTAKQHPDFNGWDSYADGFARAFIETAPVIVPAERSEAT